MPDELEVWALQLIRDLRAEGVRFTEGPNGRLSFLDSFGRTPEADALLAQIDGPQNDARYRAVAEAIRAGA